MDLYDAMRTTFAAREYTDDPLPDDVLYRILDNARFAPSGGNRQGGHVIVVRDMAVRPVLVDLVIPHMKRYIAQRNVGESPWNPLRPPGVDAATIESTPPPAQLYGPFLKAPVLLVVCLDLAVVASTDQYLDRIGIVAGASIYPLVWNILLAARNEGYGGTITTFLTASEPAVKEIFGIPEQFALCAVVPLGKPVKQLTRLKRRPVEEFAMLETWDGPPLADPG